MLWRDIVVVGRTRKKKKKKGVINFNKIIVGTFVPILYGLFG